MKQINDIELLQAQNEALKRQNKALQHELMQLHRREIGLCDKYGNPIKEGDVLKETYLFDNTEETEITRVQYLPEVAGFVMMRDNNISDYTTFDEVDLTDFEIIGRLGNEQF